MGNNCCAAGAVSVSDDKRMRIEDSDFSAVFDGEKWKIEWKWVDGEPKLKKRCPEYAYLTDIERNFIVRCCSG